MLEVGSKVRFIGVDLVLDGASDSPILKKGEEGTIVEVNPYTTWPYECVFSSVTRERFALAISEIQEV